MPANAVPLTESGYPERWKQEDLENWFAFLLDVTKGGVKIKWLAGKHGFRYQPLMTQISENNRLYKEYHTAKAAPQERYYSTLASMADLNPLLAKYLLEREDVVGGDMPDTETVSVESAVDAYRQLLLNKQANVEANTDSE